MNTDKSVAIIGGGLAGLVSAKYCLQENISCVIYEQTGLIGGTWNYSEKTDLDEYGLPIHSSMYKYLKSNLPKELMTLEDFPHSKKLEGKSYIVQPEVLEYVQSYAKHFNIPPHVKFFTHVTQIKSTEDGRFIVDITELKTNEKKSFIHDYVMVCRGHYSKSFTPHINGIETFTGTYKHSHVYRVPDEYKGKTVLVVGSGQSGINISDIIVGVAKQVIACHSYGHVKGFNSKIIQKPRIKHIQQSKIIFEDNTEAHVDSILFCTGYLYTFPFLSEECGITVKDNYVSPLFKQIININHPNMAFIGVPFTAVLFRMFCLQVRFFIATINGHYKLPSKKGMLRDLENYIGLLKKENVAQRHYHRLDKKQADYYTDLATTANITNIPPVMWKLYRCIQIDRNPNYVFEILDEENYVRIK